VIFIMANTDGVGPGGKGDKPRPTDKKKYDEGYDRIWGNKDKKDKEAIPTLSEDFVKLFALRVSESYESGIALYEAARLASEEYYKRTK